jgi:hypothetical protein
MGANQGVIFKPGSTAKFRWGLRGAMPLFLLMPASIVQNRVNFKAGALPTSRLLVYNSTGTASDSSIDGGPEPTGALRLLFAAAMRIWRRRHNGGPERGPAFEGKPSARLRGRWRIRNNYPTP